MDEPAKPIHPDPGSSEPSPSPKSVTPAAEGGNAKIPWPHVVCLGLIVFLVIIAVSMYTKPVTTVSQSSCVANLKAIDGAIKQWALENGKSGTDRVDMEKVVHYLKGGVLPKCFEDGTYSPGLTVADTPICSKALQGIPGHSLP